MQRLPLAAPIARIAGALLLVVTALLVCTRGMGGSVSPSVAHRSATLSAGHPAPTSPSTASAEMHLVETGPSHRNSRSPAAERHSCRVRSAAGLPLERLEWRALDANGTSTAAWRPVPIHGGEWLVPGGALPLELREPLHLSCVVELGAREVALEPRSVLILRGEDESSTGLVAADTVFLPQGPPAARWMRNPTAFVVVADPNANGGASIRFSLKLTGGFQAEGEWWPTAGARDEWVLSRAFGAPLASADLELLVQDPLASDDWRMELLLEPLEFRQERDLTLPNGRLRIIECVEIGEPEFIGDGMYRIADVPLGREYQLYALAPDATAIGRSAFRFEGQFVWLVPVAGARFSAQLVDARTALSISNKDVRLDFKFGDDECFDGLCVWNGYVGASTDSDGTLEFTSLQQVRLISDAAWPPPARGRALVAVAGYQPTWIELTAGTAGPGLSSLGTVELLPLEPDLRVVEVCAAGAEPGEARLHLGGPGQARSVNVYVRPDPTGSLALFFEDEEGAQTSVELTSATRLALTQAGSGWRWLQRDGEDWREVPSTPLKCWVYASGPHESEGRLVVRWGELEVDFGRAPRATGRCVQLGAPADGLTLALRGPNHPALPLSDGAHIEL